jgi:hypothetical protein
MASIPLVEGSYGVGSNGVNVCNINQIPQQVTVLLKSQLHLRAIQQADVMGIGLIDQIL